jgi:hypothetical protein
MNTEPTQTTIAVRTAAFSWRIPQCSPREPFQATSCIHFYGVTRWSLTLRRLSSEARLCKSGGLTSEVGSKADLPRSSRLQRFW